MTFRRLTPGYRIAVCLVAAIGVALSGPTVALAENWPAWRGPGGLGVTPETDLPTTWDRDTNVRWRVPLPDRGNSTPIVWGQQVFLTQAIEQQHQRTLMSIDRHTGRTLWQDSVHYDKEDPTHKTNPYCSPSPVTDGQRVIAWFGSAGLHCWDMQGKRLWIADLGPQRHMWGYASSPVIFQDLCILSFGPGDQEFMVAVDKETGQQKWRTEAISPGEERNLATPGAGGSAEGDEQAQDGPGRRADILRGSWATPLVIRAAGRDMVIMSHPHRVTAYDPATGRRLWYCRGLGPLHYSSPVFSDGVLVSFSGYFGGGLAVRPGGSGNVTETHRLWHHPRSPLWLGCGVIRDRHLYTCDMRGIGRCFAMATGQTVWEQRLPSSGDSNASWSSLVLSGERVYLLNQAGDTLVFRAGTEFELLQTNSLGEPTNSSIAVSNGQLFIRTHESLWCIAD